MVPEAGIGYPAKQLSIRHSSGFRHRDTGMELLPFAANHRRARAPVCVPFRHSGIRGAGYAPFFKLASSFVISSEACCLVKASRDLALIVFVSSASVMFNC
jgi:hypothetical protein